MGGAQAARLSFSTAQLYADRLLRGLGLRAAVHAPDEHSAISWARSGLMALTGHADGPPLMCPVPIAACADGALAALASLAPPGSFEDLRGSLLLAERAAITGYSRRGAVSPGGCHLLECADGWLAVNLTRQEDWEMLPAWLEHDVAGDWDAVAQALRRHSGAELVERARELGLAVAPSEPLATASFPRKRESGSCKELDPLRGGNTPLVVDLSSLWAGPLCSHLLQRCGADVIKVESLQRPDGARHGHFAFFDLLNSGKRSVALDFASAQGRGQLRALLRKADIVIEATRPRALRQLGIEVETLLNENPRLTWISISGYGRVPATENWIAYGDDAGVAAGLSHIMFEATGERVFAGDAIGDPLTGLHAALAAYASFRQGGGRLIALSLVDVVRQCIALDLPPDPAALRQRQREWTALAQGHIATPQPRRAPRPATALGADTAAVLARLEAVPRPPPVHL